MKAQHQIREKRAQHQTRKARVLLSKEEESKTSYSNVEEEKVSDWGLL